MDYPASVANVGLVGGKFANENPTAGVVGSLIPAEWGNGVTDELVAVIKAAGLTPSETDLTQLLQALRMLTAPPAGMLRNGSLSVPAAAASATFTADEILVGTALGGQTYRLANFSQSINLGTVGAGGMDIGSAPASGFVALYAIYNPTTKAAALLAVNASSARAPEVYGGANRPSGYTASALVSVWPTTGSGQLAVGYQKDRRITTPAITALSGSSLPSSYSPISLSGGVPINAKTVSGLMFLQATSGSGGISVSVASDANGTGRQAINGYTTTTAGVTATFSDLALATAQLLYFTGTANGPSAYTDIIATTGYSI